MQLDVILEKHGDLLQPLLPYRVALSCFRSDRAAESFNLRHYRRASVDDWVELLTQLSLHDAVSFFCGHGDRVAWPPANVRGQLDRVATDRATWVGFTEAGGAAWERVVQLDWRGFYAIGVSPSLDGRTQVTVTTYHRRSLQRFDETRRWPATQVRFGVVACWPVYYWKTIGTAHQAVYALNADEYRVFESEQVARSRRPELPVESTQTGSM